MNRRLTETIDRLTERAHQRIASGISREWWIVKRPNEEPLEVFFHPPATQAEVLSRYPGCGVTPR